jgi:hypothetical protein
VRNTRDQFFTIFAEIDYANTQSPGGVGVMTHQWNQTTTFATFDYDGATNDWGYYPDSTLRFAQETMESFKRMGIRQP